MKPPRKKKFEYNLRHDGLWYWHIKGANGEIVAQGEGLSSAQKCLDAFAFLCDISPLNTTVKKLPRETR